MTDHGTTTHWQPTGTVVFLGSQTGYCATTAESCCGALNFFTNNHNAQAWATDHPEIHDTILDQRQSLQTGFRCFGALLRE